MAAYGCSEARLSGVVTTGLNPHAMFLDPRGLEYTVQVGDRICSDAAKVLCTQRRVPRPTNRGSSCGRGHGSTIHTWGWSWRVRHSTHARGSALRLGLQMARR